jgi:2-polyprenyl-3-methyl-5-hydroxy-6-metoxy-1,4-benzoquinol methylase
MQHGLDLMTVICSECSFVFTNPLPARETYERFYREAYADYYGHITPKPLRAVTTVEPPQFSKKFSLLTQSGALSGSRLLEVGPGNGLFLWWAQRRGYEALGVEPSPEFCSVLAAAGLPYLQGVLSDVRPGTHGLFDFIFMSHVLEHFYDPNEALQHCRSLLKESGILAVEVPNILKPFRSLDRYSLRYVHPSSFSPRTLQALLEKHGFRPLHADEGGADWKSPQNLFVIAEKQKAVPDQPLSVPAEADQVLRALQDYRRRWRRCLAPKWYTRSLVLGGRRIVFKLGRPMQRFFANGPGKITASGT